MSHNVGRIVTVPSTRIGPDGPLAPVSQGVWESSFTPQPALAGGTPRFVLLHLTAVNLPGSSRVEVELGYGQDVFTAGSPVDVWTRPIDPALGPIVVRYRASGATGGVTLAEYGAGEPWTTTYPTTPYDRSWQNSVTNADLFLHTDPYVEPTFQVWLRCGGRRRLLRRSPFMEPCGRRSTGSARHAARSRRGADRPTRRPTQSALRLPSLAVARARPSPARSLADRPAVVTTEGR